MKQHDPVCTNPMELTDTQTCAACTWIARGRIAGTIETLRYLADAAARWDSTELADWADMVQKQPTHYVCCPFCQEIGCDPDCPLRHTREQPDGWTDTNPDAV